MNLRGYQREAIDGLYTWFSGNTGNPLLVLPTAAGKSVIQATFVHEAIQRYPSTRVLLVSHVKELLEQNVQKLLAIWPDAPIGLYSAGLGRRDTGYQITVAGIQSVHQRALELGMFDLVMVDECFVGDTYVSTPHGPKRIDSVRVGDEVHNALGTGVVTSVFQKHNNSLMDLSFSNGTTITCTRDHPFFTASGWREAQKMEIGEGVFGRENMPALLRHLPPMDPHGCGRQGTRNSARNNMAQAEVLLNILLEEAREPDERQRHQTETEGHVTQDQARPYKAWRQRGAITDSAVGAITRARGWLAGGNSSANQYAARLRLSELLQDGFGKRISHALRGDRRVIASRGQEGYRSEKDGTARVIRLEGVKDSQRGRDEAVFNLRVSGHPSYFANGVLVHNCHLIPPSGDGMYRKFIAEQHRINELVKVIGMTATPYRMKTGRLDSGDDALFDGIAYEVGVRRLIDEGYLSNLISKKGVAKFSLEGVGTRGGEFIPGQLEKAMDKEELTRAAVDEMLKLGGDRRSWIIFCAGVEHAYHVRDEIRGRGIGCETVTGETPDGERASILRRYKAGEIRVLTNCDVLTTGFDAPNIDMLVMLRPTKSTGLYVQIVGRGMRLSPGTGKKNCLVLDYAGNIERHGPIDEIVVKKPRGPGDGGVTGAPVKECPECQSLVPIAVMQCPDCGHIWPAKKPVHESTASFADILSNRFKPQIETIHVTSVEYSRHKKLGKPDSVRVDYHCGLKRHTEWVCFSHEGYPRMKASHWWMDRKPSEAGTIAPNTDTFLEWVDGGMPLKQPSHIEVNMSPKYPEIVGYKFDAAAQPVAARAQASFADMDDDIPF